MDGIEIRVTAPTEYREASAVVSAALMFARDSDEEWGKPGRIASWDGSDSLTAWDGGRCVGHVAGYRFETLLPGGTWLQTNGVTRVGVLSTHRRRGLMRGLLERLLADALARGQVLASLRASETRIYQRFGFGLAGRSTEVVVRPGDALPLTGAAGGGSLRLLRPDEILDTLPAVFDRCARRPGFVRRPAWYWQRYLHSIIEPGGDAEHVVVHTSPDGVDDGYIVYRVKWKERSGDPGRGAGEVYELWGADPSVELALWEYLCGVDLVDEWHCGGRPVDDAVQFAVDDTRAHRTRALYDEQWLRILDVDAALGARAYADVGESATIAVNDALLPANDGVWTVSAAGAKRAADGTDPDLTVDVRELAAAYLGGTPWRALAAAGRVDVRTPSAIAAADALFAVGEAPFCGTGF
jgi:predicted acetyltransferase